MSSQIKNRIEVNVYEEILNGNLRPYLDKYYNKNELDNLIKRAQTQSFLVSDDEFNFMDHLDYIDYKSYGFRDVHDFKIEYRKKVGINTEVFLIPTAIYEFQNCDFEFTNEASYKVKKFIELIGDNLERIRTKAEWVFENSSESVNLDIYSKKNIQRTNRLLFDAKKEMDFRRKKNDWETCQILFFLCEYLIQTILFFQEHFKIFLNNKSECKYKLYRELYQFCICGNLFKLLNQLIFEQTKPMDKSLVEFNSDSNSIYNISKIIKGKTLSEIDNNIFVASSGNYFEHKKLIWNGQINVLADVILQLTEASNPDGSMVLEASKDQLGDFLINNFLDKDGHPMSKHTLNTLLKPSRTDKRLKPDSPRKINITKHFNK